MKTGTASPVFGAVRSAEKRGLEMSVLWWSWILSAIALIILYAAAGQSMKGDIWGALIDERGRCSLARFHFIWWSLVILPIVAGVIAVRFTVAGTNILGFVIPTEVQALLGVAGATSLVSIGVKARKDSRSEDAIAASPIGFARLDQMLTVEEGTGADETVDVGKTQSLAVTILLGLAYILTTIHAYMGLGPDPAVHGPQDVNFLPSLDPTFISLFAISSAAYTGIKAIPRPGTPAKSLRDVRQEEASIRQVEAGNNEKMDPKSIKARRTRAANERRIPRKPSPFPA